MNIIIKNIEMNKELDSKAMVKVQGGFGDTIIPISPGKTIPVGPYPKGPPIPPVVLPPRVPKTPKARRSSFSRRFRYGRGVYAR